MFTWTVGTVIFWVVMALRSGGRNTLEGCRTVGLGWKMKDAHPKRRYTPSIRCINPRGSQYQQNSARPTISSDTWKMTDRLEGEVLRHEWERNAYGNLVGKYEGKGPLDTTNWRIILKCISIVCGQRV